MQLITIFDNPSARRSEYGLVSILLYPLGLQILSGEVYDEYISDK